MFKKLFLAGALIALPMMFTGEKASAFGGIGIGYGGYGHGYGVAVRAPIAPYASAYRYSRVATPYAAHRYGVGYGGVGYGAVGYGAVGYRAGYGGVGYGRSCAPVGYGYGHHHHHRPRAGVSLRFGF